MRRAFSLFALSLGLGCSEPSLPAAEEPTTTHAIFVVERGQPLGSQLEPSASAFGGVLRMASSASAERVMHLAGLLSELPRRGTCEVVDDHRPSPSLTDVEGVQMLDVGDVTVQVGKQTTKLARHAFPSVTGMLAGVMYSSRERDAESLSPLRTHSFAARGSGKLPRFSLSAESPAALSQVTVGGISWQELERISVAEPITLKWEKGAVGDSIWVEFGRSGTQRTAECAFDDSLGEGTIPAALLDDRGAGTLSLHRLRQIQVPVEGLTDARLQFDYRITQRVTLD